MKYDYSKNALKIHLLDNVDAILNDPKIRAIIAEHKSAEDDGDVFINAEGYDQINEETGHRTEVKYTDYVLTLGGLRIHNLYNKKGKCDFVKLIDAVNNRVFQVPAAALFKYGKFYGQEFRWSNSYNKKDKFQRNNTSLILKYEVK